MVTACQLLPIRNCGGCVFENRSSGFLEQENLKDWLPFQRFHLDLKLGCLSKDFILN